jgi:hypothetical protein
VLIMKSMSGAPWWLGFGARSVERPSRIGISFSLSIVSTSCVIELNLWTPSFTFYTFPLSRTWINSLSQFFGFSPDMGTMRIVAHTLTLLFPTITEHGLV